MPNQKLIDYLWGISKDDLFTFTGEDIQYLHNGDFGSSNIRHTDIYVSRLLDIIKIKQNEINLCREIFNGFLVQVLDEKSNFHIYKEDDELVINQADIQSFIQKYIDVNDDEIKKRIENYLIFLTRKTGIIFFFDLCDSTKFAEKHGSILWNNRIMYFVNLIERYFIADIKKIISQVLICKYIGDEVMIFAESDEDILNKPDESGISKIKKIIDILHQLIINISCFNIENKAREESYKDINIKIVLGYCTNLRKYERFGASDFISPEINSIARIKNLQFKNMIIINENLYNIINKNIKNNIDLNNINKDLIA